MYSVSVLIGHTPDCLSLYLEVAGVEEDSNRSDGALSSSKPFFDGWLKWKVFFERV